MYGLPLEIGCPGRRRARVVGVDAGAAARPLPVDGDVGRRLATLADLGDEVGLEEGPAAGSRVARHHGGARGRAAALARRQLAAAAHAAEAAPQVGQGAPPRVAPSPVDGLTVLVRLVLAAAKLPQQVRELGQAGPPNGGGML